MGRESYLGAAEEATVAPILPYVWGESITEAGRKSRSTPDSVEFCGEFPHGVNTITRKARVLHGEPVLLCEQV